MRLTPLIVLCIEMQILVPCKVPACWKIVKLIMAMKEEKIELEAVVKEYIKWIYDRISLKVNCLVVKK